MEVALLNERVMFQRNEAVVDGVGNHVNAWTDYYACSATIGGEGLASSGERQEAGMTVEDVSMTVTVYKRPNPRTIRVYVWNKLKDYLTKAGTTIFIASILIWFILNFGFKGMVADPSESFGAALGRLLVPILKPAGLGLWQISVALISGISAKEVVVSSFSVLFGVSNVNSSAGMETIVANIRQFDPTFGSLNAFCLMLFCLLYVPCAATIATIRKESHSWKFTGAMLAFQIGLAWLVSVVVFQIGSML